MKATEGTYYTDPTLRTNWTGAERQGIYRGAYHFARPSVGSAAAQARYFVSKVGSFDDPGDLPPVLDLEATGGLGPAALRTWVKTWLETTEQLTGRTPILYFSPYFWIDHLGNSTAFARYPLWIAHYTTRQPQGARRLEHLDVLAAHQQRLGQRHRRPRRHEPLQRHQCAAGPDRERQRRLQRAAAVRSDAAHRGRDHAGDQGAHAVAGDRPVRAVRR